MATDPTWSELVGVCIRLNKPTEAMEALHRIDDQGLRARASGMLMRHGLMSKHHAESYHPSSAKFDRTNLSFAEEVGDSFRFLFIDHMPLTVMVITMIFPLVIGLGGVLTAGSHSLLLPLIALIPALSALGLVGALGRQILLEASRGLTEPPSLPGLKPLAMDSCRFLVDGILLSALTLGPGILLFQFTEVHFATKAVVLAFGVLFLPMAMAVRQVCDDWRALNPMLLIPAISKGGAPYLLTVSVAVLMMSPAVTALILTMGSQIYLQISVIGPLSVVPLFVISRLLGRVLDLRRKSLGRLIDMPTLRATQELKTVREHGTRRPAMQTRKRTPRPRLNAPAHPETAQKASWKPKPISAIEAINSVQPDPLGLLTADASDMPSQQIVGEQYPDLTQLPGACVFTGKDRENAGAASDMKNHLR